MQQYQWLACALLQIPKLTGMFYFVFHPAIESVAKILLFSLKIQLYQYQLYFQYGFL